MHRSSMDILANVAASLEKPPVLSPHVSFDTQSLSLDEQSFPFSPGAGVAMDASPISHHAFVTNPSPAGQNLTFFDPNAATAVESTSPSGPYGSVTDEYTTNPTFLELQNELRSLLFTSAHSNVATRIGSPVNGIDPTLRSQLRKESAPTTTIKIEEVVNSRSIVEFLKNYIDEVAPWLDMFDVQRHFGIAVPILAQSFPPLLYAILAISARQVERKRRLTGSYESLRLYQDSIRLLSPQLEAGDPKIMATCVVLCCLEMMSASPRDWRNHLDGCAALFDSYGIHGFSGGLLQAVFWCYARMDLCCAIISNGCLKPILPVDRWIPHHLTPDTAEAAFLDGNEPDVHANYSVFLCAKVCDLLARRTAHLEQGHEYQSSLSTPQSVGSSHDAFARDWLALWEELQRWLSNRPRELVELEVVAGDTNQPFPRVLYAAHCAISSNQLYHTSCILLMDIRPSECAAELEGTAPRILSPLWHARRICGISLTNEHHGCLNNAIQPLWVAGKLLTHRSEHRAVVKLVEGIEALTGWGAAWRIRDLLEVWGYEPGEKV